MRVGANGGMEERAGLFARFSLNQQTVKQWSLPELADAAPEREYPVSASGVPRYRSTGWLPLPGSYGTRGWP